MTTDPDPGQDPGQGYDPSFLAVAVPLPVRGGRREDLLELTYTHFTVVLDTRRRLAATTACMVDGALLVDVERGDDWFLDPRVPVGGQAGPELYARNDLDRGHLVRRRDPVWGPPEVARRANVDTFAYTNAAPQAAGFNQGMELWLGLEDHVLAFADSTDQRIVVVTGPVLAEDDAAYRGVQVPRRFYKVVAWTGSAGGAAVLASAGFVLDQTPLLDDLDELRAVTARALREGDPPPLGPFRSFQVPVADVETLTGLDLGPLAAADRLGPRTPTDSPADGAAPEVRARTLAAAWVPLLDVLQVELGA